MSLNIKNVSKNYNDKMVLQDISIEIDKGETFCVFGKINSGKSVLMRLIAGMEKPDNGAIFFDDTDLSGQSFEERKFHFPNIKNDSFWNSFFNKGNSNNFCDGEKQILALEDALENVQDVLLLDNSLSKIDRKTRLKYYELVRKKAKEQNISVLFATNDYYEVFQIADKVAVLSDGEILQVGTPREIYEKPKSKTVAEVFGENNIFDVRRITSNKAKQPEFFTIDGEHRISTSNHEKEKLGTINQTVSLAIRPEHISISFGASFPEDNLIKATITEIIYRGSTTMIRLDANGLELKALVLRLVGLNMGDECMVGLPPERILVLKD